MPIKKAAFKHLRQTKRRAVRNKAVKDTVRSLYKKTRLSLDAKKMDEAQISVKETMKALDKAARKGVIKKNAAARKKSRLMKRLNKATKA